MTNEEERLYEEALEKRIPKKYKTDEFGYYRCPCCYDYITKGDLVCKICLQRIDWSEE